MAVDASEALVGRVQELTAALEQVEDLRARGIAEDLVAAIMALYGEGLERIFGALAEDGAGTSDVLERLTEDGVVASLMLIHDLYPVELETRVHEALASVRPYMESHGGDIELVGLRDGVAHLRLVGHCRGCPASEATLELAIKRALEEHAPDLLGLEVEGVEEPAAAAPAAAQPGGFELPVLQSGPGGAPLPMTGHGGGNGHVAGRAGTPSWASLAGAERLPAGSLEAASVDGVELLVANVGGSLLAYRNGCAWCRSRLEDAPLSGVTLTCPSCDRRFDLRRAGRSPDDDALQLEPVPLLSDDAGVRVALPA